LDALLVLFLVIAATALLVTERLRADLVAMTVLAALIVLRVIEPSEALSGFSNQATVTVACMFVISAGLRASGVVGYLGDRLLSHGPSSQVALLLLTALVIAPVSAFVNNTAVVAIFLPIILRACQGNRVSPSQLMMPLSFFAMMGGTCTLIGTSTNILVSSIAEQHGIRPFKMFEFSIIGMILLFAGVAYHLLVGRHFVPERIKAESPTQGFPVNRYLSEVVVQEGSSLIGQSLVEAKLGERFDLEVVGQTRDKILRSVPGGYGRLLAGDILLVKTSADSLVRLGGNTGLAVKPGTHPDVASLTSADSVLFEAVITPNSDLDDRTLKGVNFRQRYGATTLAIRRGEDVRQKIGRMRLRVGDELLIVAPRANFQRLREQSSFVILQELDVPLLHRGRAAVACLITAGVVTVATAGWYPVALAALIGAVLMVLTGCLPVRRVYQDVEWQVIFLLAGLIPLGVALETTGAAAQAVDWMLHLTGDLGPTVVLGLFFLMASILTGFMSNAATAVLLAPLAITIAGALSAKLGQPIDPRPFLIALTFAASAAFWTPIGYQTNLLVYGPGGYRFADFVRIGGPLTLVYWVLATLLIPRFFPF
jgi:di/tricarboxylate transporter